MAGMPRTGTVHPEVTRSTHACGAPRGPQWRRVHDLPARSESGGVPAEPTSLSAIVLPSTRLSSG